MSRRRSLGRIRPRINTTVSEDTRDQLQRCESSGRYLDRLVEDQRVRWQSALATLQKYDWQAPELYAARVVLAYLAEQTPASQVQRILSENTERAAREYNVDEEHWLSQIRGLDSELARALVILARESISGNPDVGIAIEEWRFPE